jgi:predicted phage tail protein
MTTIRLHGILAKEYTDVFSMKIGNPSSVFAAIDCNHRGFTKRVVELQKQGFVYDMIVDKTRITDGYKIDNIKDPKTIDLVPVIVGSGAVFGFLFTGSKLLFASTLGKFAGSLALAGISAALAPKPDTQNQQVTATADAKKSSFVFGGTVNTASQGTPVPIGYGRLKVGSKVIQATIKSFPQNQQTQSVLTANPLIMDEEGYTTPNAIITSRVPHNNIEV